jgi:hypothetical protein
MRHKNFVFEDNIIQYRFSKKELEDIGADFAVIKSMKVFIQKQRNCNAAANEAKAHVLLSVTPTERTSNFGYGDKTRWFKTDIVDKDLTNYHKRLMKITSSTNSYISYAICLLNDNDYAMNIIDELAYKFYDNVVDTPEFGEA